MIQNFANPLIRWFQWGIQPINALRWQPRPASFAREQLIVMASHNVRLARRMKSELW